MNQPSRHTRTVAETCQAESKKPVTAGMKGPGDGRSTTCKAAICDMAFCHKTSNSNQQLIPFFILFLISFFKDLSFYWPFKWTRFFFYLLVFFIAFILFLLEHINHKKAKDFIVTFSCIKVSWPHSLSQHSFLSYLPILKIYSWKAKMKNRFSLRSKYSRENSLPFLKCFSA